MERGWDPEVKKYLLKIVNSIALGLLWLMSTVTAGLYYGLAFKNELTGMAFYIIAIVSLILYIRYLTVLWKK